MKTEKKQSFYIVYDGPALESNEMDVRQLAPALHAIGDLLDAANRVLNGKTFRTQVKVKGSFKTGCFGIDLVYCQSLLDNFVGLFTNDYVDATLNLAEAVGLVCSGFSLIQFTKWLRGRPIRRIIELEDNKVRVEVDDEHMDVERAIIELFKDVEVRKALDSAIKKPLEDEGITSFGSGKDRKTVQKIAKNESAYFAAPEIPDELISESEYETVVKVVNVAFQEDNMWRLAEGPNIFHAKIEDEGFLKDVHANEKSFAKDDLFFVTLKKKQYLQDSGKIKTEFSVTKVNDHRSAMRQIKLPFDDQ